MLNLGSQLAKTGWTCLLHVYPLFVFEGLGVDRYDLDLERPPDAGGESSWQRRISLL